jgi:hypothetical protein
MFGFGRGLPIAPTGEFPGFVNPEDPVRGESDLVVRIQPDDEIEVGPRRRGRRLADKKTVPAFVLVLREWESQWGST